MADEQKRAKTPRIRKTAPTVRERAEAAQAKAEKEKPQRARKVLAKVPKPRRYVHIKVPNNRVFRAIGKVLGWLAPRYFVNAWRELRQVTWPNRRETWRLTAAVFVFAIIFGAMVAGVDKGLDEIFKKVVLK